MSKRVTTEQLEAIRKRAEAATEGPWKTTDVNDTLTILEDADRNTMAEFNGFDFGTINEDNAVFTAHAREDIPALLAEVERLRTEANNLERFSTDHLVYELMSRDEESEGDTE